MNAAASHALENDDIATFSSHPNSPLTAATLALGEKLGSSGRDFVLAWLIGWEITAQTMKVCLGPRGNELINRGWFNQGFQETLGVAALAAKLLHCDIDQTRMALGNAASAMAGMMKNRGTDTKGFTAGSAAMHGVIAAELARAGFTADPDILDGDLGVARLLGLENGDPQKMLDGLGSWDLATRGATIRLHACCGASHWSMDALQQIVRKRPVRPDEIASIDVEIPEFLTDMVPFHEPSSGLQGKYSLEYSLVAIALDGRAGIHSYTDEAVRRPEAQSLMQRVNTIPVNGPLESRVVLKLTNGERVRRDRQPRARQPGRSTDGRRAPRQVPRVRGDAGIRRRSATGSSTCVARLESLAERPRTRGRTRVGRRHPMAYDIVVKGARIVDGTGKPAYDGDVAIQDGRIAAVGDVDGGGSTARSTPTATWSRPDSSTRTRTTTHSCSGTRLRTRRPRTGSRRS